MFHNLLLFLLLLVLLPLSSSSLPDLPYEEIISTRRPFHNTWPSSQLPTNWSTIPCSSIISATSSMSVGAMILCNDGSSIGLYSLSLDSPLTWTGESKPLDSILATSTFASSISGDVLFLLIPGGTSLIILDCNAQQLACNATSITLSSPLPAPFINSTAVMTVSPVAQRLLYQAQLFGPQAILSSLHLT